MKFRSKNLLVTGGSGFIGSNFINYILNKYRDTNIINIDLLTYAGNIDNNSSINNSSRYKFIKGDICDAELVKQIFNDFKIDGVINFAAETHVDNSIKGPDVFIKTNINGVFNLLNNAYKFWMNNPFEVKERYRLSRFHQISTDEVYGSIIDGSFNENSKYSPNSPYSSSKASGDLIVRSYNKTFGLNTTISISSNNFGINQHNEKLIPMVVNCLIHNKPIPIYGDGMNIRDWIDVNDHCNAIDMIYNKSKPGESYNVGAGNELTNLMIIDLVENIISKDRKIKKKIKFVKDRFGHDRRYSLDTTKIKSEMGWEAKNNFRESLTKYIKKIIK